MNYHIFFRPFNVYHSKISVSTHGLSNVICCDAWLEIWTLNVRDFPYLQTNFLSYAFFITSGGSTNNKKSLLYEMTECECMIFNCYYFRYSYYLHMILLLFKKTEAISNIKFLQLYNIVWCWRLYYVLSLVWCKNVVRRTCCKKRKWR